ncbi:MAG: methyltransferase domain-containing protein, partial [Actinomycetota bacterium]
IDPVPLHVEQANDIDTEGLTARIGDSRSLDVADNGADIALLMGPLYHLTDATDRAKSLRECWRVLRHGGVLVAAAISRWAPLFDVVIREALDPADLTAWWATTGRTGNQRAADAAGFTTARFHRPADLRNETEAAGFSGVELLGVEGCTLFLSDHLERMADPQRRELLLSAAAAIESESELAGLSAHMIATAYQ